MRASDWLMYLRQANVRRIRNTVPKRLARRATPRAAAAQVLETLETRILPVSVTGTSPVRNTHSAAVDTDISVTINSPINASTANDQTLLVHAMQTGQLQSPPHGISVAGSTVTVNPVQNLHAGEFVQVTVTSGLQDTSASAVSKFVYQFRTDVAGGSGIFASTAQNLNPGGQSRCVAVGDLDGDGDVDAVVGNYNGQANEIWLNQGGGQGGTIGTFSLTSFDGGGNTQGVALGDVDLDGDLDIVTAGVNTPNKVWINQGGAQAGTLGQFVDSGQDVKNPADVLDNLDNTVALGDMDGDGDLDAVFGSARVNYVIKNNGDGTFGPAAFDTFGAVSGENSAVVRLADLDGDGDLDAFVANNGAGGRVYLNNGNGDLTDTGQVLANGRGMLGLALGDLDGDGDWDAFTDSYFLEVHVWTNNGSGFFTSTTIEGSASKRHRGADLADIDGDGDLDAALVLGGGGGGPMEVWLNNGSGAFSRSAQSFATRNSQAIAFADFDNDGDVDYFVTNHPFSDSGANQVFLNVGTPPGFTIVTSDASTIVNESGTTDTFTVVLASQPSTDVVLTVTSSDTGEATSTPTLTFTNANWNVPQVVTVTGANDPLIDGSQTSTITVRVDDANSNNLYDGLASQTVLVTTTDDDVAGFTVVESGGSTSVADSGVTDTFTVVLNAQPNSNVVFTVVSGNTAEVTIDSATLTFTSSNWNTPQTVTVTGVNDFLIDGTQQTNVTISVDDATSDNNFDALANQTVVTATTNDDVAGFTIVELDGSTTVNETGSNDAFTVVLTAQPNSDVVLTVAGNDASELFVFSPTLTFTSENWSVPQTVLIFGVDDFLIDGTQTTIVTVGVDAANSDNNFDGVANQTVSAATTSDDVAGFTIVESGGSTGVAESGTTDTFTVVLNAQPDSNVVLTVASGDTGESTVGPATLTFTSDNWNSPQTVTVTGVDDRLIDGTQTTLVTIAVDAANSDNNFDGVANQTVSAATTSDDVAGFTIVESGGSTGVAESGTTDTFTVVLNAQPDSDVVLTISSGDTGEAEAGPSALTFNGDNWDTPQTVTVTGGDDFLIDGTQTTIVTVGVNAANSDNNFDGVANQTVSAATTSDDVAGFTIVETGGSTGVAESGTTDSFTVVLNAQPDSNVVLLISNGDIGEATSGPATLTFTSDNWNSPQTVTVTGVDDFTIDGTQTTTITIAVDDATSDNNFDSVANQTVLATTTSDDVAGFTIVESSGSTIVDENGATDSVTVVLTAEPFMDVVINVTSGDPGEATVNLVTLTFTSLNWNVPQVVTVTGVNDDIADGTQPTNLTFSVDDGLSDNNFDALADQLVIVTTEDNDLGLTLPSSGGPFTVRLVSGNIEVRAANGSLVVDPEPLTAQTNILLTGSSAADIVIVDVSLTGVLGLFRFDGLTGADRLDAHLASFAVVFNGGTGNDTFLGGSGADVFHGGPETDSAIGGAGNDLLNGDAGNDSLQGGTGDDWLDGGDGNDVLDGGLGDSDTVSGGQGNDVLSGGTGLNDRLLEQVSGNLTLLISSSIGLGTDTHIGFEQALLIGSEGANSIDASAVTFSVTIQGSAGNDTLTGGSANDLLQGGDDADVLVGGNGGDTLDGQAGDDALSGREGNDRLNGGDGTDLVIESSNSNFTLRNTSLSGLSTDFLSGIEGANLTGGASNNLLDASLFTLGGVTLNGLAGNDSLIGTNFADVLNGGIGIGIDTLRGNAGNDSLTADLGNDLLDGGADLDRVIESGNANFTLATTLLVGVGSDTLASIEAADLSGGAGNNILRVNSFSGSVTLRGGGGADELVGGPGHDLLDGGDGDDTLTGNAGNDQLLGGAGLLDLVIASGGITFVLSNTVLTGVGSDTVSSIELARLTTSTMLDSSIDARLFSGATTLTGSSGADTILGGMGADLIVAGAGDDVLAGNNGADSILAGAGSDIVLGGAGDDSLSGSASFSVGSTTADGDDTILGGAGNDRLIGGAGNDILSGELGNDTLYGDSGADSLFGGAGLDTPSVVFTPDVLSPDGVFSDAAFFNRLSDLLAAFP